MKKAMLMILDGWGIGKDYPGNAILQAKKPNIDRLIKEYPHTEIEASGLDVGLPEGQMGNSEVGHLNIGAGRIIYQDLTLINKEIREGSFFRNKALNKAIDHAKTSGTNLHLMGLVSEGGVHSHLNHLIALLQLCKMRNFDRVYIHCFMDGRDVSPTAGKEDLEKLLDAAREIGVGEIATVIGRYYAMDRDKRWERVKLAYDAMFSGDGVHITDPIKYMEDSYNAYITDEFIEPAVVFDETRPVATVEDSDSIIFFNFRPDRAREIVHAVMDTDFRGFERQKTAKVFFVAMTEYDRTITNVEIAYPPDLCMNTLGEVISRRGLRQARIAETEKYAHVTFFFNGGVEVPNAGEDRFLIPSPKVATYDLKPEMSAYPVTDKVRELIASEEYALIILNFANCDMVGHTGIISAEIEAVEAVDDCVGKIVEQVLAYGVDLLITADHGNGEQMIDEETGGPFTAHTTNPVPLIYVSKDKGCVLRGDGKLSDIAPTLLEIMDIPQPMDMTGNSLIVKPLGGKK